MKDYLEKNIRETVENPSQKEIGEILDLFEPKHFNKNDFIKEPFTISRKFGFLVEGTVRAVYYTKNGEEVTYKIHESNNFITDVISFRSKKIMPIGFKCMDKASLLLASQEKMQALLKTNLTLNIVIRECISEKIVEMGKSYFLFLTGNSKERYEFMLENHPYVKKFPLHFTASMIGITPTQLSRIRNEDSK